MAGEVVSTAGRCQDLLLRRRHQSESRLQPAATVAPFVPSTALVLHVLAGKPTAADAQLSALAHEAIWRADQLVFEITMNFSVQPKLPSECVALIPCD